MTTKEKPIAMNDEHAVYLDELRESGETNVFGARPYLMAEFPELSKVEALAILMFWMSDDEGRKIRTTPAGEQQ